LGAKKIYTEEFIKEVRDYCNSNRTSHPELMDTFPFLSSITFTKSFLKKHDIVLIPFTKEEKRIRYKRKIKENYGVENVFQLNDVKDKIKNTNIEKYGVDNYTKTKEYIEKTKKTNMEKYGVE
jgi:hypothetical protein